MRKIVSIALVLSSALFSAASYCQSAVSVLTGSPSPGTGGANINLTGTTLNTDVYFANLDSSSKGAYIMCCDAQLSKTVRATGSLISSIAGKNYGTARDTFDTSVASFWDAGFSGGDPVAALAKLSAALKAGQAHFIVTSASYPDDPGEISGPFKAPIDRVATRSPDRQAGAQRGTPARPPGLQPTDRDPLNPRSLALRDLAKIDSLPLNPLNSMRSLPGEEYGFYPLRPDAILEKVSPAGDKAGKAANDYLCSGASQRCLFPVYVSSVYDANGIAITCEARVDYGVISVPPHTGGKPLRIVWLVVEGDVGDVGDYRFMDMGIELVNNDPRLDFNGKGRETADGKRFKWLRVGARLGTKLDYNAWIERVDPATGRSITCKPADPMIANTN